MSEIVFCVCEFCTHAVLHHHEATFVALKTFALKAAWCVDTGAVATQVRGDAALINVWKITTGLLTAYYCHLKSFFSTGRPSVIPVQFLSSAVRAKPLLQRHLKLPMVFRQFPCVQRPWNTLHSFTSGGQRNEITIILRWVQSLIIIIHIFCYL